MPAPTSKPTSAPTEAELQQACQQLQQDCQTLMLSTLEGDQPQISYTPFVRQDDGCFYIFISALAAHTQQLMSHPKCSIMLIRDEAESRNLFARERLIFQCQAEQLERSEDESWMQPMAAMEVRLGETVNLLKGLSDFSLFRLTPQQGRYVVGFGKAYDIDPISNKFIHIDADRLKKG